MEALPQNTNSNNIYKNASRLILGGIFCLSFFCTSSVCLAQNLAQKADERAQKNGFTKEVIKTAHFNLLSYSKFKSLNKTVRIYIEGDGHAWESKRKLSKDPTPRSSVLFDIVSSDPRENVVYLARPCQYGPFNDPTRCNAHYWSTKRFSEEVIDSANQAIDQIKEKYHANSVELVGYSGGAAVAVLVAVRRKDVSFIRTIAGNLNHKLWTKHHNITSLAASLDAIDVAKKVSHIPQEHYVGGRDKVMPRIIAESFVKESGSSKNIKIIEISKATHDSGWKDFE